MTDTVPAEFRDAAAHHQAGHLAEAETIYLRLLDSDPEQPDVLNLLGVLSVQNEEAARGAELLTRAARVRPDDPSILTNLATALMETGARDEAIERLRAALLLDPDHLDALYNLGNALAGAGQVEDAAACYRRAVDVDPSFAAALNNLALCLIDRNQDDEALAALEKAVTAEPEYAEARGNLGLVLHRLGHVEDAEREYHAALSIDPNDPEIHNRVGLLFDRLGRPDDARRHFETALRLVPGYPEPHLNLGNLLKSEERFDEAAAAYRRALELQQDYASAHNNLGNVLVPMGAPEKGIAHLERALALRPNEPNTLNNLGKALRAGGRLDDAITAYDRALDVEPGHRDARFGRAEILLSLGRFQEGWADYLARSSMANAEADVRRAPFERDLSGKRILVERDQGLGDEIFFLRFLGEIRDRGAHVAYRPDPRLAPMLRRVGVADEIIDAGEDSSGFDMRLAVGDLPHLLQAGGNGRFRDDIPLKPLPEATETIDARLRALGDSPYVAVTWRAGTKGADRALFKEVPLAEFARAVKGLPGTFIAVQRIPGAGEIEDFSRELGRQVHDLTALNDDLEAMLALMAHADAYAAVSNTNVHLRASCGRSSHVLVPNPPEFRWMAEGDESPWFPGSRSYRQRTDGSWSDALAALRKWLGDELGGP